MLRKLDAFVFWVRLHPFVHLFFLFLGSLWLCCFFALSSAVGSYLCIRLLSFHRSEERRVGKECAA